MQKRQLCLLNLLLPMLTLSLCQALGDSFAPATYYNGQGTATTNKVYVACYGWQKFKSKNNADGYYLGLVSSKTAWSGWSLAQHTRIKRGVAQMLDGSRTVSRINLNTWATNLSSNGISTVVVLPEETPAWGWDKLFIFVMDKGITLSSKLAASYDIKQILLPGPAAEE